MRTYNNGKRSDMASNTHRAQTLIADWKGDDYTFGLDVLDAVAGYAKEYGTRTLIVSSGLKSGWIRETLTKVTGSLDAAGVSWTVVAGAAPNAPREDVYRIANEITKAAPDSIIALGGGSTIDAVKASAVLSTFSPDQIMAYLGADESMNSSIEPFFGVGRVTAIEEATGVKIKPVIAVQTVSSSAAHITKYSNVTDPASGQKKLLVDMAIVPPKAVFDFGVTAMTSQELTLDGGLDGISHIWEVFMGASGKDFYGKVKEIAVEGLSLIFGNLPAAVENPGNIDARTALGYGTDLGGYAIMVGGTNGGHLGSFSLVDVLAHGRACAVLNPYYTVLFADAVQDQLLTMGGILKDAGYIAEPLESLDGRARAEVVAKGMIGFSRAIGFPATLKDAGANERHIERMIAAAKNPQLDSKLKNMPIPMDASAGDVDTYMRPVLEAAYTGDFSLIESMRI